MTIQTAHKPYHLGLALSGGGAKGFAHLGVFKALEECGLRPEIISGTSAGALMGALYADGYSSEEIRELFTGREFSEFAQLQLPKTGLFDSKRFRYFLRRHLRAKNIEDLKVPMVIVATDLEGTQFRFSLSEPPYVDTEFTLRGDQFARHFGLEQTCSTTMYGAVAIQLHVDTVLTMTEAPNMNTSREGFNAPATLLFTATANDPVASRYVWRIYKIRDLAIEPDPSEESNGNEEGDSVETRSLRAGESEEEDTTDEGATDEEEGTLLVNFSGNEVEYTFQEQGVYRAVAEVSDQTGTCEATESIELTIATSYLDIPNVFSPGMTPGINDEFRVAYKSLVSFKGWIYNRWGKELFHWTDPAQGWDGRKGGKLVAPGVYYYVIEAVGSDGRRYKRAGDVNILRSKQEQTETIETEE